MPDDKAIIHLTRAYGLIKEVEAATESFRRQAIAHAEQSDSDEPFLKGMIHTVKGERDLKQQKGALASDLDLAEQEIMRAASLDPVASIKTKDGPADEVRLKCFIAILRGNIEMIWGRAADAIGYFQASCALIESAQANYMLGMIYESERSRTEALSYYERCLDLEPVGEYSVSALRASNAIRTNKGNKSSGKGKRFQGSWIILLILFVLFFPAAILYFFVKRK